MTPNTLIVLPLNNLAKQLNQHGGFIRFNSANRRTEESRMASSTSSFPGNRDETLDLFLANRFPRGLPVTMGYRVFIECRRHFCISINEGF